MTRISGKRALQVLGLVVIVGLLLAVAGCGAAATATPAPAPTQAPAATEAPAATAAPAATEAPAAAGKKLRFGFVLHITGIPFTASIERGARQAAANYGVDIDVVGPPKFDNDAQVSMFEAFVQKKVDGLVTVPAANVWDQPVKRAMAAGIPILLTNVDAPNSGRPAFYGENFVLTGNQLGDIIAEKIGKKGKIGIGWCATGVSALDDRVKGMKQALAKYPDITVMGPIDMTAEPSKSYDNWAAFISGNPDMKGVIGSCATDTPSEALAAKRLNRPDLAVGGYDLQPDTLQLAKEGFVTATFGQAPYLQGYLPVMDLVNKLQNGIALERGMVTMPAEIVTKDNVDQFIPRETDAKVEQEWYAKFIKDTYAPDHDLKK